MKKLMAIILTLAMVMSLCVVPASAAGSGVTITITPDQSKVDTTTGDAVVTYTVKAKVTDPNLKVGSLTITLDPGAGLTLADKDEDTDSAFYYQENVALKYDKTYNKTGIFGAEFSYAPLTKTFVAVGTTQDRNLNSTHGEVTLMTIMGKIAKGTTGSVTLKTTQHSYGDPSGSTASVDCDVTPATVTITKAPITSVRATVSQPVKGYPLDTSVNVYGATAYTADVMWKADGGTVTGDAQADTVYTALITLKAKEGESFSSSLNNTTTPGDYSIEWLNSTELLLTKEFDRTQVKGTTGITIDDTTLTVAVPTAEPNMEQKAELPLTAKVNYDDGTNETVNVSWSIVTDPKPDGVDIEEDGKLTVTNKAAGGEVEVKAAYNGMTDTKTVTITKDTPVETAIVLTAPTPATVAVPKSDTPNKIDLPAAAVYDQYGMPMTGPFTITYAIDGTTPTGVTLVPGYGKIEVYRTAQDGEVKIVAKLGTTLTSDPVAYTITRETSQVTSVHLYAPEYIMNVPKVTEPGATNKAYQQFDPAKVLDQYGQEMTGKTVTWNVADDTGNSVTGVSIDNNGKLTVTNEAPAITVYVTATCSGIESNKSKVTIKKETAKASLVEICNQVGEGPETRLLIPTGSIPWSEDYTAKVYDQYGVYMPGEMVHWALDPATVTGVEMDDTSIPGSATLKVNNTATSGTTFKLKATTATLGTSGVKELDITLVNKTPASVTTAPKAVENLKYTGNDQALVTEGVADGGTMQYSLNGTAWTNTVPTGKNAGDYTVYYKVKGDSTHTDYTPASNTVSVSIAQKEVTVSDITVANKAYDGDTNATVNASGATFDGKVDGDTLTITATGTFANADVDNGKTVTLTLGTLGGASAGNYKLATTGNQTTTTADITQATLTVTPVANQSKKFKEADPALTYNYSGNVSGQTPAFNGALSRAEGEDVGQYDITLGNLTLKDNGNFKASNYELKMVSSAVKFEIKKADAPEAPTGLKGYKDSALSTVTLPTGWSWVDGTLKMDTIGDQTFQANYAGDTNHEAGNNVNVTVKVVRRSSSGGYYYAPTVPDMPMLYRGCTGDAVKTLQDKLNALGYNSGSVDGIFGAKTYAAVTAFQKANSLGVDGIVGKLTWGKLYGVSPAMPVETTTVVGRPTVSYGSRGDAVRKLQELLNALGYDCGSVDGIFGSKTKAAVLAFQKANGLGVDGIVGPLTWAKLG